MNNTENSLTKTDRNSKTSKFRKAFRKVSKPKLLIFGFVLLISLVSLIGLVASSLLVQEEQDQRSQASEGMPEVIVTASNIYVDPLFARYSNSSVVETNLKINVGRPITGVSFALQYNTADVSDIEFQLNSQYSSGYVVTRNILDGNKAMFVIYQYEPNDQLAITSGDLGVLKVTAKTEFQQQSAMSIVSFVPQDPSKTWPNQAVVLNRSDEIISLNATNGLVLVAGTPFSNAVVPPVTFSYRTSQTGEWTPVSDAATTLDFQDGTILRATVKKNLVQPTQLPVGTDLKPSFRMEVKDAGGAGRGVKVAQGWQGNIPENYVQDLKVMTVNSQKVLAIMNQDGSPQSGQYWPFNPTDVFEIAVNARFVTSGLAIQCTNAGGLVIFPEGNPQGQQQLGSCSNNSLKSLRWGGAGASTSPTPTPPAFSPSSVPLVQISWFDAAANPPTYKAITTSNYNFLNDVAYRLLLNKSTILPALPASVTEQAAFRVTVKNGAITRGTIVGNGTIGGSGNYVIDIKPTTVGGQRVLVLQNINGTIVPNQQVVFLPGDRIDVTVNLHRTSNNWNYTCKENNLLVTNPVGAPEQQVTIGSCVNSSLKSVTWQ